MMKSYTSDMLSQLGIGETYHKVVPLPIQYKEDDITSFK